MLLFWIWMSCLTVVAAEQEKAMLPSLQPDPTLRARIQSSFRVHYVLRDERDKTLVQVMIQVDKPITGMAFDMALRAGQDTWPLGPVAWATGKIEWWAYDTDLPEQIQQVDVVLTPSASAGAKLKRLDPHHLMKLDEIYDGPPVVLAGVPVREQWISMVTASSRATLPARDYAMEQFDPNDPIIKQLKSDGDWPEARARFQRRVQEHPDDIVALFHAGCLAVAEGHLAQAMKHFVDARNLKPSEPWARNIQRQLRHLCATCLARAEKDDAAVMCLLGRAYEQGWGVGRIVQEAKRWYVNAANAGHAEAMCRLAAMYEHETGATVQTEQAHQWYRTQSLAWYRQAADLGNEEAKQWLAAHARP